MRRVWIALSLLATNCAGYTSVTVTCAPQLDSATVYSSAAASCGTITVSGNTPTATATTTTTVPIQAPIGPGAGLGLGPNVALPPMSGAVVIPQLSVAPVLSSPRTQPSRRLGARVPTPIPSATLNSTRLYLDDPDWPARKQWLKETSTYISALDGPRK